MNEPIACELIIGEDPFYELFKTIRINKKMDKKQVYLPDFKPIKYFMGKYSISTKNGKVSIFSHTRSKLLRPYEGFFSIHMGGKRTRYKGEQLIELSKLNKNDNPHYTIIEFERRCRSIRLSAKLIVDNILQLEFSEETDLQVEKIYEYLSYADQIW